MALKRAKELDEVFEKTGKPVGPLHGLPISLKDQFRIKVITPRKTTCLCDLIETGPRNLHGLCIMDR
jgi:Asp-tRNA(Asn)/Glu-tRNA(Gln) amidotransferase A subunit family amidase